MSLVAKRRTAARSSARGFKSIRSDEEEIKLQDASLAETIADSVKTSQMEEQAPFQDWSCVMPENAFISICLCQ